jgi:ArsR family transcriptional regulator, arsenate/arsenite/antimonite-responsive transcriptional repressor
MSNKYSKTLPKQWKGLAEVFTALGDEHRQRILLMFERGEELTIKTIAEQVPLSRTAVTHHVRALRDSGVLTAEKRGKEVYLTPDPKRVLDAIEGLRSYIKEEYGL